MCSRCQLYRAAFTLSDGEGRIVRVCAACLPAAITDGRPAMGDAARFVMGLARPRASTRPPTRLRSSAPVHCAECGLTYAEAAHVGLLGCPACYEAFGPALRVILQAGGLG